MNPDDLTEVLAHLPAELIDSGIQGHCDAFAVALRDHLQALGVPAPTLVVISRQRIAPNGRDVVDDNPLSHVIVEALGTSWDVLGPGAADRWGNDWIQPDPEEGVDEFEFTALTVEQLGALRQQRDHVPIDPTLVAAYRRCMEQELEQER